jgi:hypothetical protein
MSGDLDLRSVPNLGAYVHKQFPVALLSIIPTARVTSFYAKLSNLARLSLLDDI